MNSQNDKTVYTGEDVIKQIQAGRQNALNVMYPRYQQAFLRFIKSWNQSYDEDTLIEAYMEAVTIFYTNVTSGHLTVLTTTVENYLIAIGKNFLMKKYKRDKHTVLMDDISTIDTQVEEDVLSQIVLLEMKEEKKTALLKSFAELGKKCQELLKLSFYENLKASQIKEIMNYKDETTVYVTKAKCISHLRELILKK